MPTVYVTQLPHRRDLPTGRLVPKFTITPAAEHGDVVVMFPPQGAYMHTRTLIAQMREALAEFNPAEDALLLLGDPALTAAAVAVAAHRSPAFTLLRYDNVLKKYVRVRIDMRPASVQLQEKEIQP